VTNKVIDIKAFIDGNRMAPYQWLTLSLCFMVSLLDGIDAAAMGFLAPSLMKEWDIPMLGLVGRTVKNARRIPRPRR